MNCKFCLIIINQENKRLKNLCKNCYNKNQRDIYIRKRKVIPLTCMECNSDLYPTTNSTKTRLKHYYFICNRCDPIIYKPKPIIINPCCKECNIELIKEITWPKRRIEKSYFVCNKCNPNDYKILTDKVSSCSKCGTTDHGKLSLKENQKSFLCSPCQNDICHSKPERSLFRAAKQRAKQNNIEFNIEEKDIILPKYCPILKIELRKNKKASRFDSYSIDRIDSNKGYTKDNIQIISMQANTMKHDASIDELVLMGNWAAKMINKLKRE